jgi:hypothetical protein
MYSYLRRFYGGYGVFLYKFRDTARDEYRQIGKRDRWAAGASRIAGNQACAAGAIFGPIGVQLHGVSRGLCLPEQPFHHEQAIRQAGLVGFDDSFLPPEQDHGKRQPAKRYMGG